MSGVSSLKERKIIELIHRCLEEMPSAPISFGDDVSAVTLDEDMLAVLTVDMFVGKTDMPPGMTLYQAARKAVVMNISDLASKGVKPSAVLTSLGLPRGLSRKEIVEIGRGLNSGAREYGAYVIGGDTNEASDLIIDCVAFGKTERKNLISRSGAKPGDIVATTGDFGNTACGFKILLEGFYAPENLKERILRSVYEPKARVAEGYALARSRSVTASIDSSDGLAWSLYELSKMSGVGFLIDEPPVSPETEAFAKLHSLDPVNLCLYGGEEYELVLTVKPERWLEARSLISKLGSELKRIGVAIEEKSLKLKLNGEVTPIEPKGWEHFE
ncbi:thiamine-phosphate kinase [Candidatus Bathyarchaeota archaeon]|nr:thiamine-phosphate kinase [Candidatus Bathyarchaeota archaeon]